MAKPYLRRTVLLFSAALALIVSTASIQADEIIIHQNSDDSLKVGDFDCSPCPNSMMSYSDAVDIAGDTVTAGQLWKYFQSRGITKLERMSLQVDVDYDPNENLPFELTGLNFRIEGIDEVVTDVSLKQDRLLVDNSEISSMKPEAVLAFDLGYDFMSRFSPDSTETVVLNFDSPAGKSNKKARIVVAESHTSFSFSNLMRISGFLAFWAVVFFVVFKLSKPNESNANESVEVSPVKSLKQLQKKLPKLAEQNLSIQ